MAVTSDRGSDVQGNHVAHRRAKNHLDGKYLSLIVGGVVLVGDVGYRRNNAMTLFDLRASTVFFIIPTWLVGAAVFLTGVLAWLHS